MARRPVLANLELVTRGDARAWAVTGADGMHRYLLGRTWSDDDNRSSRQPTRSLWCFGMLNPSKATHDQDDPTIRKCAGFAARGGARGFVVVNLFAYSATHPRDLVSAAKRGIDIRGEHNDAAIRWAIARAAPHGRRIAAWGVVPSSLSLLAAPGLRSFLVGPAECLGVNLAGSPKHPLRLGYDRPITGWSFEPRERERAQAT